MTGSRRLEVLGGAGTVVREGAMVAWFAPGFAPELASELLDLARSAPVADGASGLASALEAAASSASSAFGIVVETAGSHSIALRGHVVVSEDGLERLRGTRERGLVSADLAATSSLTLRGENDRDQMNRPGSVPYDLRDGVVPGGGVTFWASSDRPVLAAPPALDERVVLFDLSVPLAPRPPLPVASTPISASDGPNEVTRQPAPETVPPQPAKVGVGVVAPEVEPTEPAPAPPKAPQQSMSSPANRVRGVNCARGHFNNPRALYCGICGLGMVQNSVVVVEGSRPPLGVLLLDDGTAYSLDHDYVLGREPDRADDVVNGGARPLKVDDGTGKISRVHARVSLRDWDVVVTDLGSHNGTRVFNPGDSSWRTLRADDSIVLQPRGRLVVGQSTFEFQSIQRQ
jgi:hypothetical protein